MKKAMDSEDQEHDLTLSLRCGSPKRTKHSSSPSLPQINIPSMELPLLYPNFVVPSFNHNIYPLFVSCSNNNTTNPSLASSSNQNTDSLLVLPSNPSVAAPTPVLKPRSRRASSKRRRSQGKSETIPAPFPWATDRRATIHNRKYLLQNNVLTITGKVQCKKCAQEFEMSLDLEEKVNELRKFIQREIRSMHDRAPAVWVNPVVPKCVHCGRENCTKPIPDYTKKRGINWLFLLLGQMLGFCTLDQLKYFCKHTNNIRTGAKDRFLYITYMTLWKQLVPESFESS